METVQLQVTWEFISQESAWQLLTSYTRDIWTCNHQCWALPLVSSQASHSPLTVHSLFLHQPARAATMSFQPTPKPTHVPHPTLSASVEPISTVHSAEGHHSAHNDRLSWVSDSGRLTFLKETARSPDELGVTTGKLNHSLCHWMVFTQIFVSYESMQYKSKCLSFLFNGSLYGKIK